jgi:glycosyltransferase involved in cell wall biosynthesis
MEHMTMSKNNKMRLKNKILFLLHIPPPVHGSSVVGLSIKNSETINSAFNCEYINLLASQDIAESGTVNRKKLWDFAVTWVKLLVLLRKFRPNLSYLALTTTGAAFFKDALIVLLLKVFKVKRIYHLHNRGVSLKKNNIIYRLFYNFVFRNSEVILLSKRLYHDIEAFVPETKVFICPNGISDHESIYINSSNTQENQSETKTDFDQSKDSKKVMQLLFLSNLIESKGVFDLLDACALLKIRGVTFACTFIGGESDITANQFRNRLAQLDLLDHVAFEGKKYNKEKELAYTKADIFVFPTFYSNECFPLVLLEAMSYALPVVSTFEGGIQDIVEINKTGLLVEQHNTLDLADKLEFLITNPHLCKEMGLAGRKKYEQKFTLDRFENRLEEILQQVIEQE